MIATLDGGDRMKLKEWVDDMLDNAGPLSVIVGPIVSLALMDLGVFGTMEPIFAVIITVALMYSGLRWIRAARMDDRGKQE